MNVAVDRIQTTYSHDLFKKDRLPIKKIGTSTNPGKLQRVNLVEYKNYQKRERRKKEIEELEKKTLLRRRREQTRQLTPRQLDLLNQIPLFSQESLDTSELSPVIPERRTSLNIHTSSRCEPSFLSFGEEYFHLPESEESVAESFKKSLSEIHVRFGHRKQSSLSSVLEDEVETWKEYSTYHETKQYQALMQEVCKWKTYDISSPKEREKMRSEQNIDLWDKTFNSMKKELSASFPWPEDAFFGKNYFKPEENPFWMVQDIRELVTVPDQLAVFEDCHISTRAATVRMAAWDYLFYKSQKPGEKNVAALFCKFAEGETPVHKFLYPSNEIANLSQLECLWKPLMESDCLEEYCAWLNEKHPELIPKYLENNGYVDDLIRRRIPHMYSPLSNRGTLLERQSVRGALNRISPQFKRKIGMYS